MIDEETRAWIVQRINHELGYNSQPPGPEAVKHFLNLTVVYDPRGFFIEPVAGTWDEWAIWGRDHSTTGHGAKRMYARGRRDDMRMLLGFMFAAQLYAYDYLGARGNLDQVQEANTRLAGEVKKLQDGLRSIESLVHQGRASMEWVYQMVCRTLAESLVKPKKEPEEEVNP